MEAPNTLTPVSEPALPAFQQIVEPGDHALAISYLAGLVQESVNDRSQWQIDQMVEDNLNVYAYGDTYAQTVDEVRINDIQNQNLAQVNAQSQDPPSVTLEPVEIGEPSIVYWRGPAMVPHTLTDPASGQPMVDPATGQPMTEQGAPFGLEFWETGFWEDESGQTHPPMPVRPEIADQIIEAVHNQQIPEKWVVEVNDQTMADTYQGPFDLFWTRSNTNAFNRRATLKNAVAGFIFALYEWDPDKLKHVLRLMPHRQVYIDPTVEDIADAAYAGVDIIRDAREAMKLYPDIAEEIAANSKPGTPNMRDGFSGIGSAFNRDFKRPIITLRIFWLRDELMPVKLEEAIASGMVEQRVVVDESPELQAARAHAAMTEGEAKANPGMEPHQTAATMAGDELNKLTDSHARLAYFEPGTETELDEKSPQWPHKRGIRQITIMVETNLVVDDRECEHWDIPLLHNTNIPLIDQPYGLGEPYRLKSPQRANNRVLTAMVDHAEFFKSPIVSMSQSAYNSLPAAIRDAGVKAGMMLIWPDEQFQLMGGKPLSIQEPSETPPALVQLHGTLKTEINDNGNYSDASRGILPSAQASGKTVQLLQGAAASQHSYRGLRMGDMVYREGHLMLHSIVRNLTLDDMLQVCSKYERHIMAAFMERGNKAEWNVKVNVPASAAQAKAIKDQQVRDDLKLGLIDLQTAREKLGYDHRQIESRLQSQAKDQARMMAEAGVQPGQEPAQEK